MKKKEAEIANRPAPMSSYNDRVAALEEAMLVMLSRGVSKEQLYSYVPLWISETEYKQIVGEN